jgi:hypothetical protein
VIVRAVVALALLVLAMPAAAATPPLTVPTLTAPPPLDPSAGPAGWAQAASATLEHDVTRPAGSVEPTTVRIATDGRFLYVRFDAVQHAAVVATQHSNDVVTGGSAGNNGTIAWGNDDAVWVDLWPTGPAGFAYQFEANANGSHNEASSENAAFAPQWDSRGAVTPAGYTVTMAIPLAVLHGARTGSWRAQFARYVRASGAQEVWSSGSGQTVPDGIAYAGTIALETATAPARAAPRIALYALGSAAAASAGGNTSHAGADVSVPVTATADVFATIHPDYSNVELDQQTIAPQVYQRVYTEVRPFFTQAASYYNTFTCTACAGYRTILYAPGIPTPSQGYAFEGRTGNFGLAGFDALGVGRTDAAGALDYTSPDTRWNASFEHVSADVPGIVDDANETGVRWSNLKYLSLYANYSRDAGTNVTEPAQAQVLEAGGGWANTHFAAYGSLQRVGAQFAPVDGLVAHPGIAGYGLFGARVWEFAPSSPLAEAGIAGYLDSYAQPFLGSAQSDTQLTLDVLTKRGFDVQIFSGSDYWRFGPTLAPVSQNAGFNITYHGGVQTNNPSNFPNHGTSATPTEIEYLRGHYGDGILDTWLRTSTIRAGERGSIAFTLDDTAQRFASAPANVQWFDGVAYAYQIGRTSSLAVGLRRVDGLPPQPNGGGNCAGVCSNVSVAYHVRARKAELYLAYGDPNALTTAPQAILKLILYLGAEKGT